jgi:hypothetical protein
VRHRHHYHYGYHAPDVSWSNYHSNDWLNNWAGNNGWGSYWYNYRPGTTWIGNGASNWQYTDEDGPALNYTWPPNYNLYVDPKVSNYRKWPAQYYLHGGPGAAQAAGKASPVKPVPSK